MSDNNELEFARLQAENDRLREFIAALAHKHLNNEQVTQLIKLLEDNTDECYKSAKR